MTYESCTLCPRRCGVDRTTGQRGYCQCGDQIKIARAAAHYWEEPVISGSYGSGAVFFSGCTLGCAFCQNEAISHRRLGKEITPAKLRELFEQLVDEGCQNINLVTATQYLPSILPALYPKLPVPVVYNCGGYESVETLKQLEGLVDIYLPDFKYSNNILAKLLSRAPKYQETASAAILEMFRQTGPYVIKDEQMTRGVLLRHLILPGHRADSSAVLRKIAEILPVENIRLSLMAQYTPEFLEDSSGKYKKIRRRITSFEYQAVLDESERLGFDGYSQERTSATKKYTPDF